MTRAAGRLVPAIERHRRKAHVALILVAIVGVLVAGATGPLPAVLALAPACLALGIDLAVVLYAFLAERTTPGAHPQAAE